MSTTWPASIRTLIDAAGPGWTGLWSLLLTTERAVSALVQVTSFAEGLDLIWLGEELRAAGDDIATHHPEAVATALATDLGPVASPDDVAAARVVVADLLSAVIARGDELLVGPPGVGDGLWLSGLTASLFAAQARLTGAGAR